MLTRARQPDPGLDGAVRPAHLCEWAQETEALPQDGDAAPDRIFSSIFYPPWAWSAGKGAAIQASLTGCAGYSFVTFRVACDT